MNKQTIRLFIASIACIVLSIIVAAQITILHQKGEVRVGENVNKEVKQTHHFAIDDTIQTLHIRQPNQTTEQSAQVRYDIRFHKADAAQADTVKLEYYASPQSSHSFIVDLEKVTWDTSGDVLTMHLNQAMEIGHYHSPMLYITLPHRDWKITGLDAYYDANAHIFNEYEPISLEAEVRKVSLSGKFEQLSLWRTGDSVCFNCINIRGTTFDTLNLFFGGKRSQAVIDWMSEMEFNRVNLHMDKNNSVDIVDLSTLPKIRWFALTEADKERLRISDSECVSEQSVGSTECTTNISE